jgi:hypothetical protein
MQCTHCLTKGVFMGLSPTESARDATPSKMFLTPKKLPSGALDKIKARPVAGGHRQDRSHRPRDVIPNFVAHSSIRSGHYGSPDRRPCPNARP